MNLPKYPIPAWIVIGKGSGWCALNRLTGQEGPVRQTQKDAVQDAENYNRIRKERGF